jgi:hypothetical protein
MLVVLAVIDLKDHLPTHVTSDATVGAGSWRCSVSTPASGSSERSALAASCRYPR